MKEGDKVNYYGENGIVKSIDGEFAHVVYNCNQDWDNYQNYTAARTPKGRLKMGWV